MREKLSREGDRITGVASSSVPLLGNVSSVVGSEKPCPPSNNVFLYMVSAESSLMVASLGYDHALCLMESRIKL